MDDFRQAMANHLKRSDVPEPLWQHLKKKRYLIDDDGYRGAIEAAGELLALARDLQSFIRVKGNADRVRGKLQSSDQKRQEALSVYIGKMADQDAGVRQFRKEVLGGRLLDYPEAFDFLLSLANQYLPRTKLEMLGIPLVGHRATGEEEFREEDDKTYQFVYLNIDPPGVLETAVRVTKTLAPYRGKRVLDSPLDLWLYGPDNQKIILDIWPGSVLDELRIVSDGLEKRFGWESNQATYFILCGDAPDMEAWNGYLQENVKRDWDNSRIILELSPWISQETVTQIYREFQEQIMGRKTRKLSDRKVELFRWVSERMDGDGKLPTWEELRKEWNQAHPTKKDQYKSYQYMNRDFRDAVRVIPFPRT